MTKDKPQKYRSARLGALRETAQSLTRVGAMDKKTMRAIESFCLTKVEAMTGSEIQALREREGVSQAVLAQHLNVGTKLVSDWERGAKKPSGPSLKLLTIVKARGLEGVA
jgi:putative transcriptional regulator